MSIAPILLISFIAGYYFIRSFYSFSYKLHKHPPLIQYLQIGLVSVFLFFISVVFYLIILYLKVDLFLLEKFPSIFHNFKEIFYKNDDINQFHIHIILLINFFIGISIFFISNFLLDFKWIALRRLKSYHKISDFSSFEPLVFKSIFNGMPISLTMSNGKIYIGFINQIPNPTTPRKEITLLPLVSGYRDDKKQFHFTTYYTSVYKEIQNLENENSSYNLEIFQIVLPFEYVQSANLFDFKIYNLFRSNKKKKHSGN